LIGLLWAVGVGVEVAVFIFMAKWIPRFGERNLMLVSLALAMVRWVVIALYPEDLTLIFIAQSFHAASFGVIHAVSIHLIHDLFRGKLQGRGQALYSSVSFGAGGVVGSLLGGIIWVSSGSSAIFIFSALLTLIAFIVTWIWIRPQQVDIFKLNS
jgi:PPP family 3-phenylpropionic acid transporter